MSEIIYVNCPKCGMHQKIGETIICKNCGENLLDTLEIIIKKHSKLYFCPTCGNEISKEEYILWESLKDE